MRYCSAIGLRRQRADAASRQATSCRYTKLPTLPGGWLTTRVRSSSYRSACPHLSCSRSLCLERVAPYAAATAITAGYRLRSSHTGYKRHSEPEVYARSSRPAAQFPSDEAIKLLHLVSEKSRPKIRLRMAQPASVGDQGPAAGLTKNSPKRFDAHPCPPCLKSRGAFHFAR